MWNDDRQIQNAIRRYAKKLTRLIVDKHITEKTERSGVKCDCEQWKKSQPQIEAAQWLAWTHGQEYTGDVFNYCPWCGKDLREMTKR